MGGSISKMMGKIFGSKEMRLLMLGLDAAGKTSMIHPCSRDTPAAMLFLDALGQWAGRNPDALLRCLKGTIR